MEVASSDATTVKEATFAVATVDTLVQKLIRPNVTVRYMFEN